MDTLTKEDHHPKPEADQIQMGSTRESEEEEHKEKKACILCNPSAGLCKGKCSSFPTQVGCPPDQKAVQAQLDPVVGILNMEDKEE